MEILVIVALPWALLLPRDQVELDRRAMAVGDKRRCPACAELIRREAVKCRFCGTDIEAWQGSQETLPDNAAPLFADTPRDPP